MTAIWKACRQCQGAKCSACMFQGGYFVARFTQRGQIPLL